MLKMVAAEDLEVALVVAASLLSLQSCGYFAYILWRRRRRAKALPFEGPSEILLSSTPSAPQPQDVPVSIGSGISGNIITQATVWQPAAVGAGDRMPKYDTYDIMKKIFIRATGCTEKMQDLVCVVHGQKKNHDAIVFQDSAVLCSTEFDTIVIWMWPKAAYYEKAKIAG